MIRDFWVENYYSIRDRQGKLVNVPFLGSQYLDLNELAK